MANMEKGSTLLIIREVQMKTTMRYHLTPITMVIKKSTTKNATEGAEKWECKLVWPPWKFLKRVK